jgi:hemerythrin-like domain-containing protein
VASPVLRKWMREHDEALRRLALMDKSARAGDWGPVAAVAKWLYDELKTHNEAEEQFLFPLMDPFFGGGHGPTDCMRSEHRAIWAATLELQEQVKTGSPADAGRATTLALQIAGELGAHIDKENNVLYPMAERMLGPQQLKALEESFFATAK